MAGLHGCRAKTHKESDTSCAGIGIIVWIMDYRVVIRDSVLRFRPVVLESDLIGEVIKSGVLKEYRERW